MKFFRILFLVLAAFFVMMQLVTYMTMEDLAEMGSGSYAIGYFIGSHIFLAFAVACWLAARSLGKKIRRRVAQKEVDSLPGN
jgi:heme/copper-type cytochrome/quinol oxidase subunit 3